MVRLALLISLFGVLAHAGTSDLPAKLRDADKHLRAGERSKALEILSHAVESHPEAVDAHELYQDVMRAAGRTLDSTADARWSGRASA
mgnify:CR=1 FL=1